MKYELKCNCGETVSVDASSREEALSQVKEIMNEDAIKKHMSEMHPRQPIMTIDQAHAMVDQNLKQVS
ncbi:MAG: hypothetical protein JSW20_11180 [Nitrospiraceae bacterium]|nr:MAG: hypothetical protein JSW20_11180 [Nitrospiraceae bacterium]